MAPLTQDDTALRAAPAAGAAGTAADTTDGRQLRRQRNRDAVVEALLALYRDGNLKPSAEEIAARSGLSPRSLFRYFDDVDDLIRAAITHQESTVLPLVPVDARPSDPTAAKAAALADQRVRLFGAVGDAAAVVRLRAPFQPLLAAELGRTRAFLRSQVETLFAPELAALAEAGVAGALAAADVQTTFEAYHLLRQDHGLSPAEAAAVMVAALTAILGPRP
jgi:AcrR family transcriptional regulator